MTVMTKIPGRHRADRDHPERKLWTDLASELKDRTKAELAWFAAADEVSMADSGHELCCMWDGLVRCDQPGVWQVNGYEERVFCAPHAVNRAALRELLLRAVRRRNEITQQLPAIGELS